MNNNYQQQPMFNQQPVYNQQPMYNQPKKKSNLGCIIAAVVIFIIFVVVGFVLLFLFVLSDSKKLVCKSNEGSITLLYNDKTITGYTANGMTYDLDSQKEYAEKIGIDAYLDEFSVWFSTNTTGTCTR